MARVTMTEDMRVAANSAAAALGITANIHPDDHLLGYMIDASTGPNAVDNYLRSGRNVGQRLAAMVAELMPDRTERNILDFAAGYGRVVRHMPALLPQDHITASDIHPAACDFIRESLGIEARESHLSPDRLDIGTGYDFIYVLSLFTHLPDRTFGAWLGGLFALVAPGGYLMVTANGHATLRRASLFWGPVFDADLGYGYRPESDQLDLDSVDYGSMLVTPQYFLRQMAAHAPDAVLHRFRASTWLGTQDEWVLHRPPL